MARVNYYFTPKGFTYHKQYRIANREKNIAYQREYRRNNRQALTTKDRIRKMRTPDEQAAIKLERREMMPKKAVSWARARKYGITSEHWETIFEWQDSCCACCYTTDPGTPNGWHTDHDHQTGVVRGILCFRCNKLLGFMGYNANAVVRRSEALLTLSTRPRR